MPVLVLQESMWYTNAQHAQWNAGFPTASDKTISPSTDAKLTFPTRRYGHFQTFTKRFLETCCKRPHYFSIFIFTRPCSPTSGGEMPPTGVEGSGGRMGGWMEEEEIEEEVEVEWCDRKRHNLQFSIEQS